MAIFLKAPSKAVSGTTRPTNALLSGNQVHILIICLGNPTNTGHLGLYSAVGKKLDN